MTCKINLSMFISFSVQLKSKTVVKKTFSKCSPIVSIVIIDLLAGHILTLRFSKLNFKTSKMHTCKNDFLSLTLPSAILGFLVKISDLLGVFMFYIFFRLHVHGKKWNVTFSLSVLFFNNKWLCFHWYFFRQDKNMFMKKENCEQGCKNVFMYAGHSIRRNDSVISQSQDNYQVLQIITHRMNFCHSVN